MILKLNETLIPQNVHIIMKSRGQAVVPDQVHFAVESYIVGITDFLNTVKHISGPKAVVLNDLKGNFIIGAVLEYIAADDADETAIGSWNYYWTWYKSDIPENAEIFPLNSSPVCKVVEKVGLDLYRISWTGSNFIYEVAIDIFSCIKDHLDQNAPTADDEENGVELDGYFEARVAVENAEKQYSFTPKGEMKVRIKDDDAIQKTNAA